jgi:hypothetical protein
MCLQMFCDGKSPRPSAWAPSTRMPRELASGLLEVFCDEVVGSELVL